jgi:hypothetical protein
MTVSSPARFGALLHKLAVKAVAIKRECGACLSDQLWSGARSAFEKSDRPARIDRSLHLALTANSGQIALAGGGEAAQKQNGRERWRRL